MSNDTMQLLRSLRHPDADRVDEVFPATLRDDLLWSILSTTQDQATSVRSLAPGSGEAPAQPVDPQPLQPRPPRPAPLHPQPRLHPRRLRPRQRQPGRLRRHWRTPAAAAAAAAAAAVVVLLAALAGVGVIGGNGALSRPFTTAWRRARLFVHASSRASSARHGTWRLVDALLTGTWQQNDYGPPPGLFSCSPDGTCYVLAGKYPSAMAGAPLLSETLYVTTDEGATWSALPLPSGLVPRTPLECSGPQWCATGGTYDGQPVLAATTDGGHSFTIDPLPTSAGTLRTLSCPATMVCEGLAATSTQGTTPVDATLLATDDGGGTFKDEQILTGDSMVALACTSPTDCTVVGMTDASMGDVVVTAGVSAVTSNQGRTWAAGSFPTGFGIDRGLTSLSCPDAQHCFVTGYIPMQVHNPPQCSTENIPKPHGATAALPKMSAQAGAISTRATEILEKEVAQQTTRQFYTCPGYTMTDVSDVASSSNGGLTWTLELLPADVPRPYLDGLSCPTATECWTAGQESVPVKVGRGIDMASPVLIGTIDGGSQWSKVVFDVPSTAPNATGQSYLSMGSVTCPTASLCLARGAAAQGSRYAPVYSLDDGS